MKSWLYIFNWEYAKIRCLQFESLAVEVKGLNCIKLALFKVKPATIELEGIFKHEIVWYYSKSFYKIYETSMYLNN